MTVSTIPAPPILAPAPPILAGPIPTLWDSDGIVEAWEDSRELLLATRPPAVQLHTWEPGRVAASIARDLPGAQILVGVGVDSIARRVALGQWDVGRGVKAMVSLASAAHAVGALAIVWNAEASWKRPPSSSEAQRLADLIRAGLAEVATHWPFLRQWHTSYDHPTYHLGGYPWKAWLGPDSPIEASLPQVYAAPGNGLMAHRGALPRREARALASWNEAVRRGLIRPDAPEGTAEDLRDVDRYPYFQLHSVPLADTCASAVRHRLAAFWSLRSRSDSDGRTALQVLCALWRDGFWGEDAIRRWQTLHGLRPDGVVGPKTLAAMEIR